jgi:hypothetical protein
LEEGQEASFLFPTLLYGWEKEESSILEQGQKSEIYKKNSFSLLPVLFSKKKGQKNFVYPKKLRFVLTEGFYEKKKGTETLPFFYQKGKRLKDLVLVVKRFSL